ncbi:MULTISPECIES: hypothetical protein [Metabacillus]|jgi:hypothetical protein|uniref:Uncharacterized protein n=2 Tax=Metabacillus TaxID=2675233 RepID=A0A179STA2_9BACI|nr:MULTISPECIES: hypothetical protein [Metabacillus]OAS85026.1 hypothetical protein A6K24_05815 [Metabacillus litoralis]QNF26280.1 hypothetical protein HUW50_01170 [Metabacillus sp. KUDC1714]
MELTELLTNPLVWGALVWLFSRFFTSNKKDEETPKKQHNQRENRPNPRPNPRQNSRTNPKPVMTTVERKPRNEAKPALQTVQQAYESMKNQATEKTRIVKEQPNKRKVVPREQFPKVNRNIKQNNLIIDQQKAVQGVIWGEILGAPRSKNPHYTRNKRHS